MLKNKWYLICPSEELKNDILKKKIMGEDIIFFRNPDGEITALEDRCCHRNVHLSLGYLDNDRVVCGYHGWEYDKSGSCVKIPSQLPGDKIPPTAKIKSYPVKDFNKWVWIFIGDSEKSENVNPTDIPEMNEWPFTYKEYTFKADLEATAESLIDPYHIAYVHRNSIKSFMGQIKESPADFNLKILDDGVEGFYRRANVGTQAEKVYFGNDENIGTRIRFYYPNISRLEIRFKERILLILEHVMQVDEEHVEMKQITLWKNIFPKFPAFAKFFMARKSAKIVEEDIDFLSSNLDILKKRKDDMHEVSVKGDEVSLSFRKFWRKKLQETD
ncbi:MAG: aromatic ring-hydroxylating dioxygenase subunit alpha [Ignavibacteria bacterium]|jgi:phenylpropionate dioxygenase-like ring-hydroxylating dioxygenase large terminal subunit